MTWHRSGMESVVLRGTLVSIAAIAVTLLALAYLVEKSIKVTALLRERRLRSLKKRLNEARDYLRDHVRRNSDTWRHCHQQLNLAEDCLVDPNPESGKAFKQRPGYAASYIYEAEEQIKRHRRAVRRSGRTALRTLVGR